ncbi:hypothetical protein P0D71_13850, partial [Paraburkholderia sp. RL17-383-BIF-A]|uniref:hypothetical protein n=1 Tax=Paraburkholderia sp. RL17-383-BIF-A TaxID=3031631 RepID=UPI0038BAE150
VISFWMSLHGTATSASKNKIQRMPQVFFLGLRPALLFLDAPPEIWIGHRRSCQRKSDVNQRAAAQNLRQMLA